MDLAREPVIRSRFHTHDMSDALSTEKQAEEDDMDTTKLKTISQASQTHEPLPKG